ncbi:amino acid ABC transporter substrate-binding protein [Phaeobacter sp. HF9A]|nr:amino acid ABC transporter substrate-binding protein [Phaeobacter sp. HF9A]
MPGISHELLEEMSKRSGVAIDIEYLPWKRAQAVAQTTPNALLFTTSRTASRETTYTWIAEMIVANEVFATTSGAVNSVDDARSLKRIATLGGTPREKYLLELGFADLQSTTDTATAARLLTGGRVDAWYTFNQRVLHAVKEAGIDPNTIIIGAPVRSSHMWLAANAEFDAAVADKLAQALAEMRSDGTYDVIVNKYVN